MRHASRLAFLLMFLPFFACKPKKDHQIIKKILFQTKVIYGSEVLLRDRIQELNGLNIAVVCNQTSLVFDTLNLVDALVQKGISVKKIFAPEHGFRKTLEAGKYFKDTLDPVTGIPVVSLYGKKLKPSAEDIKGIDLVLFDIQDVGCRFYTYLSTLTYVLEACAENHIKIMVLDRPNPNGFYVHGPVLEPEHKSFQGLHPIPIVHGMTFGEYAIMLNKEKWLANGVQANLEVIKCENYLHRMRWKDTERQWVPPSPNLLTPEAAEWYPILCWYEGTIVSVGRGTPTPFQLLGFPFHRALHKIYVDDSLHQNQSSIHVLGHPFPVTKFIPQPDSLRAKNPPYKNEACYGIQLLQIPQNPDTLFLIGLELLQNFYNEYNEYQKLHPKTTKDFFTPYFYELSGTANLKEQIIQNTPAKAILQSWKPPLNNFINLRKKYLLYSN